MHTNKLSKSKFSGKKKKKAKLKIRDIWQCLFKLSKENKKMA